MRRSPGSITAAAGDEQRASKEMARNGLGDLEYWRRVGRGMIRSDTDDWILFFSLTCIVTCSLGSVDRPSGAKALMAGDEPR